MFLRVSKCNAIFNALFSAIVFTPLANLSFGKSTVSNTFPLSKIPKWYVKSWSHYLLIILQPQASTFTSIGQYIHMYEKCISYYCVNYINKKEFNYILLKIIH